MQYPKERKEAVLAKLMPPHNRTVADLAQEEGISTATLYNWRKEAREQGRLLPEHSSELEGWSARDKFNAVLVTAALSESELAEYCRRRGLYPEQIGRWRSACEGANDRADASEREHRQAVKAEKARSRELERELKRKESALAETAALLTLRKNAWTAAVMQAPTVDWREPATPMYSASNCRRFASGQDGESRTPGPNSLQASDGAAFFTGLGACRTAGRRHLDQRLRSLGDVTSLTDAG